MKQPVPARGHAPHPDAATRGRVSPAAKADLRVRYYYRMKPQRAYPLVVEVPRGSAAAGPGPGPVVVRPLIPGAHIVPAEQALDVNRAGQQVTFYVTPLARGRLPAPRVEVLQHGRPVGAIGLRMKAVTQRMTWLLLLLTVLVPCLVFYTTRVNPLTGTVPHNLTTPDLSQPAGDRKNEGGGEKKAAPADPEKQTAAPIGASRLLALADDDEKKEDKAEEKKDENQGARQGDERPRRPREGAAGEDQPPAAPRGRGGAPRGQAAAAGGGPHQMIVPETPGRILEYDLVREARQEFPEVPAVADAVAPVASGLGQAYDLACNMPGLYLWVALVLFGLTVLSCFLHGSRRTSRRVRLDLVAPPAAGPAQETLPLAPGEGRPLTVEPA